MNRLASILPAAQVLVSVEATSKKRAFEEAGLRSRVEKLTCKASYTLNDEAIPDTIVTLLEAAQHYGDSRYKAAAMKGGDFLLLAQMPEPQPAWAQQYNAQMQPAWARRF